MAGDRPSGTVTFLFTDIEGSTKRWEADPDAMRVELADHDDVLRAAIEGQGGWLFKHTGDGVCAAFQSAQSAVDVAVEAAFNDARASGVANPVVLFSPAAASFDQFRDFEQRGEAFRQAAAKLIKRRSA